MYQFEVPVGRLTASITEYQKNEHMNNLQLLAFQIAKILNLSLDRLTESYNGNSALSLISTGSLVWARFPNIADQTKNSISQKLEQLEPYRLISQTYTLPFPVIVQAFHLLSIPHLTSIHRQTLRNMKITKVNPMVETELGGTVKFTTEMDSGRNLLNLFHSSQKVSSQNQVKLSCWGPYSIQLEIPAKLGNISVWFHFAPTTSDSHQLYIDIYCDQEIQGRGLAWVLLQISSYLTVLEDMDYFKQLNKIATSLSIIDRPEAALWNRYYELYGNYLRVNK
ncbi:MAG: hypothetical protein OHK0017_10640 [Patescibacteria group bacterium]